MSSQPSTKTATVTVSFAFEYSVPEVIDEALARELAERAFLDTYEALHEADESNVEIVVND